MLKTVIKKITQSNIPKKSLKIDAKSTATSTNTSTIIKKKIIGSNDYKSEQSRHKKTPSMTIGDNFLKEKYLTSKKAPTLKSLTDRNFKSTFGNKSFGMRSTATLGFKGKQQKCICKCNDCHDNKTQNLMSKGNEKIDLNSIHTRNNIELFYIFNDYLVNCSKGEDTGSNKQVVLDLLRMMRCFLDNYIDEDNIFKTNISTFSENSSFLVIYLIL